MDHQETDKSLIKKPTRTFVPSDPSFEWVNPEEFATPVNDSVVQVAFNRHAITNVDGWILVFKRDHPMMNANRLVVEMLFDRFKSLGAHDITFFPMLFVPLRYADY